MAKIIIIDDEKSIRAALRDILEYEGHDVDEAKDGQEGITMLLKGQYEVALCGIKMPVKDGFDVLFEAHRSELRTRIIIITSYATIDSVREATRLGAFDFIVKPPDLSKLVATIEQAILKSREIAEPKHISRQINRFSELDGESPVILHTKAQIIRAAPTKASVLITGPQGAGKGRVAEGIHRRAYQHGRPLVTVNCATILPDLLERELFGHERGAFAEETTKRIGKLEQADGGTLFLDEVGDMSLAVQAKVLLAFQNQKVTRIGSTKEIKVNVRFIAATSKDLRKAVAEGTFREDLYHRLSVVIIDVPAVADRREDIPLLVNALLHDICEAYNSPLKKIEPDAMAYLTTLPWSGNVRELHNAIERFVIMCGDSITLHEAEIMS